MFAYCLPHGNVSSMNIEAFPILFMYVFQCTEILLVHIYCRRHIFMHNNELRKILKEMEIPDHLTYLLRNLYAGQEATVRTGHRTTDWFQIGKEVHQG